MNALQINRYGGNEVLEINAHAVRPTLKPNQLLVEVYAGSINPFDLVVRAGFMKDKVPLQFPVTMGGDFAGIVLEAGESVAGYKPKDEVYGTALILTGASGAFAEVASVNVGSVAAKPIKANFVEAAALPLVGSSAVQALEEHMKLKAGQKILIHGGGGGIGHIAIQVAKSLGARVATTVSTKDVSFVKSLGADDIVDFTKDHFETMITGVDAVFDTVGGDTLTKSFKVLKKGGILVSMKGQPDETLAKEYDVIGVGQGTKTNTQHLTRVAQLVDSGNIHVHVDTVFSMNEAAKAWQYQETGHPRGKVVIQIRG